MIETRKPVQLVVEVELWRAVKITAATEGVTVQDWVSQVLAEAVEKSKVSKVV
jgi:predicted HicB family RNase H-like nuclease